MTPLARHDVRSALRLFRTRPAFALSVVLTVAAASGFLGVAANLSAALLAPYLRGERTLISSDESLAALLPVAMVLLLAGGMVLIAACANLATLSMSHYRTRLAEFAIRASVGGTPGRLLRQLYAEGVCLSLAACVLGGIFAFWTRQLMFVWLSPEQAATVQEDMGAGATLVSTVVSLMACALVGYFCARAASGLGLPLLLAQNDSLSSAAKGARPKRGLVVAQVAIACALLVGATMLRNGLNHTLQVGSGKTAGNVAVVYAIAPTRYADPIRGRRFQDQALERLERMPGVVSADWTSALPMVGTRRDAYAPDAEGPFAQFDTIQVSSGYFETMQIGMLEGRAFDARNDTVRADMVVINESMQRALYPAGAVGRLLFRDEGKERLIVGVVADGRYRKMAEPVRPAVYTPMSTMYQAGLNLVVRTSVDASRVLPAISETLLAIDEVRIEREVTLDQHLQTAVRRDRVALVFVAACAVLIFLFAISGPYLLTRHAVTSRYDELAVRLAFGARGQHIFGLVLWQAAQATATGVIIGVAVALSMAALFSGATGSTPWSLMPVALAIAAALTTLCAISAALPAVRVYRLSPAAALR